MEIFHLVIVTVFPILKVKKGPIPHFSPQNKLFQWFKTHFNSGINITSDHWNTFLETLDQKTVIRMFDDFKMQVYLAKKNALEDVIVQ